MIAFIVTLTKFLVAMTAAVEALVRLVKALHGFFNKNPK